MSDAQAAGIRRFVANGGGLLATAQSSRFDQWGDPRPDFTLAELFGARAAAPAADEARRRKEAGETVHTYLRLNPELRARVDGPQVGTEPVVTGEGTASCKGLRRPTSYPSAACSSRSR